MDPDRKVDLIRLPREEVLYERDVVLGRDVNSVFPNQAKEEKKAKMDNLSKALGLDNSRFISASQLEEIKKTRGARPEDGTVSRDKSLAAILAENKNKKEEEFQQQWKTMKQGKNRALDDDEMEFVNNLAEAEAAKENSIRTAERQELDAFHEAVRKAAEQRQQTAADASEDQIHVGQETSSLPDKPPSRVQKPVHKPLVKFKQKGAVLKPKHTDAEGEVGKRKRAESEDVKPQDEESESNLASLLGGYGSDEND